jgi:hypothetical protein
LIAVAMEDIGRRPLQRSERAAEGRNAPPTSDNTAALLPPSEVMATDLPRAPPKSPVSPSRNDRELSPEATDFARNPHAKRCVYSTIPLSRAVHGMLGPATSVPVVIVRSPTGNSPRRPRSPFPVFHSLHEMPVSKLLDPKELKRLHD